MTRLPMGCQDVPSRCGLGIELDRGFGVDLGRLESRRAGVAGPTLMISTSLSALKAPEPTPIRISPTKKAASVCLPEEDEVLDRRGEEADPRLCGEDRWRE
jgi:hypothetical protein